MVKRFASFILTFLIISCLTSCQDKSQSPEQDLFATSSVMTVRKNDNRYTVLTLLLPEQDASYGTFKCIAGPSEGEVTLVARPEHDCDFIGWSYDVSGDEIISYHNPYTFKVSRDVAVYPVFVKDDDIIDLKELGIDRYNTALAYSELRGIESISLYKPTNLDLLVYFPYLKKIDIEFDSNTQCDI